MSEIDNHPMHCLLCNAVCGEVRGEYLHMRGGISWEATGDFGSTVFDCTGKQLVAVLCDGCLIKKLGVMVGRCRIEPRVKTIFFDAQTAIADDIFPIEGE